MAIGPAAVYQGGVTLLLLAACVRFRLPADDTDLPDTAVDTDSGSDSSPDTDTDTSRPPLDAPRIVWGDLHNHSNLSHDGCEKPEDHCLPDFDLPGEETFARAASRGLGFTAMTDHAEFTAYLRPDDGIEIDIWTRMQELVQAADGGEAFGIMGYEWTSSCTGIEGDYQATHRTVLIEETAGCAEWRIPSCHGNGPTSMGLESYVASSLEPAVYPSDLLTRLREVPTLEGCEDSRSIAFFHHTAQDRPAWVDWAMAESWVEGDSVVEIASEHGSSECDTRVATEGCDWRFSSEHHVDDGSIQYMLQMGHRLGFVGGTDNHMAEPGRVNSGPGKVRNLSDPTGDPPYQTQFSSGTLTGALTDEAEFDRGDLFDALAARHTVVASWPAGNLVILAIGADGVRYLPGDDVPPEAMPLALTVSLDDATIDEWYAEIVDPYGQVTEVGDLTIPAGDARYVRIRAWSGEAEHRVFASPFFAD